MSKAEGVKIGCFVGLILATVVIAVIAGPLFVLPINRKPVVGLIVGIVAFLISWFTMGSYRSNSLKEIVSDLLFCGGFILAGLSLLGIAAIILKADVITIIVVICDFIWGLFLIAVGAYETKLLYEFLRG